MYLAILIYFFESGRRAPFEWIYWVSNVWLDAGEAREFWYSKFPVTDLFVTIQGMCWPNFTKICQKNKCKLSHFKVLETSQARGMSPRKTTSQWNTRTLGDKYHTKASRGKPNNVWSHFPFGLTVCMVQDWENNGGGRLQKPREIENQENKPLILMKTIFGKRAVNANFWNDPELSGYFVWVLEWVGY